MDWFQVRSLMLVALRSGGVRKSLSLVEWDVSGDCQSPRERSHEARPMRRGDGTVKGTGLAVAMTVRCRTCDKCRAIRRKVWSARARAEVQSSVRTWFLTLTLRPEEHYRHLCQARLKADRATEDFEKLSPSEQFRRRVDSISPEITKYLKRVREQSGAPLRYLLVAEAHKSGAPHFHMLVHETDVDRPVTHRVLTEQWRLGFTNAKLCTSPAMATYLCKYLSKSNAARVRASLRYGRNDPASPGGPLALPPETV